MHARVADLIERLQLIPHPEGGFYREVFRSAMQVTLPDGRGPRAALTTIYFLLSEGQHSRWHRVSSDEVWHLYEGGPLELLEINEQLDALACHQLGSASARQTPVHTVAAGTWQAARPLGAYALVGCTVAPGFDFADFCLLADDPHRATAVRKAWPDIAPLI